MSLSSLGCLVAAVIAAGDDWPQFRGPTGQGLASEGALPAEWGPKKNVAWRQELPGAGWSSPIVYSGVVYLTTAVPVEGANGREQSLRALAVSAATGEKLWETEVFRHADGPGARRIHPKNSHASPTPLTDGERLYVHFGHQGTAALDLKGRVLWRNNQINYEPVHGNGGTPILAAGALIFSADGADTQRVVALACDTGRLRWATERRTPGFKKFSFSTPLLLRVNGRDQVVSPGPGLVAAYDPRTGGEIWRVRYGDGYSVVPRPVFGHGLVFVSSGFDAPVLYAIRPDGRGDVTATHVAWTLKRGAPLTPSPLLVGDELYLVSDQGIASCLDARSGKVHWQERLGGSYSASPLYGDGKVYFQSEEGVGTVIKAGTRFERLARNDLGERTLASYAVSGHALFIRTEKALYRIESKAAE
ncbi:MAG: PQQ-like beta-propeller repeat protein [Gemmataceae bacterium]|nr:PQQ-like beta-propeller repeat protein [Gemmataceae bacterium]MDW8264157.1 PQQ-binding-like beta-propeller repeat protein [Gemmataceae bacterium]